jgi:two-component system cell cycle response regulator DivK
VNIAVTKKVAIVEDNELNLRLFRDLLQAHGVEVEAVGDAREAVSRISAFIPDLVIMDIQLPHISGIDLIRQMKSDNGLRHIPIMAVTAYAGKGDEARVRDAGADAYVAKPISVARFISSVEGLLGTLGQNVTVVSGV